MRNAFTQIAAAEFIVAAVAATALVLGFEPWQRGAHVVEADVHCCR